MCRSQETGILQYLPLLGLGVRRRIEDRRSFIRCQEVLADLPGGGEVFLVDAGQRADDVVVHDICREVDRWFKIVCVRPARQLDGRSETCRLGIEVGAGTAAPLRGLHEPGHIGDHGRLEAELDIEVEGDLGSPDDLLSGELGQEERDRSLLGPDRSPRERHGDDGEPGPTSDKLTDYVVQHQRTCWPYIHSVSVLPGRKRRRAAGPGSAGHGARRGTPGGLGRRWRMTGQPRTTAVCRGR